MYQEYQEVILFETIVTQVVERWFRLTGAPLHPHTFRPRHKDVRWQVNTSFHLDHLLYDHLHFLRRFAEQDLYVLLAKILKRCNISFQYHHKLRIQVQLGL